MIRTATPADASALATLYQECFGESWDEESIATSLREAVVFCLVWESTHQLLAFIFWQQTADTGDIWYIATHPNHQRKGLARALWEGAIMSMKMSEIREIFIEVRAGNNTAQDFYRACGFAPLRTRKDYYRNNDGREDALVMRLVI